MIQSKKHTNKSLTDLYILLIPLRRASMSFFSNRLLGITASMLGFKTLPFPLPAPPYLCDKRRSKFKAKQTRIQRKIFMAT